MGPKNESADAIPVSISNAMSYSKGDKKRHSKKTKKQSRDRSDSDNRKASIVIGGTDAGDGDLTPQRSPMTDRSCNSRVTSQSEGGVGLQEWMINRKLDLSAHSDVGDPRYSNNDVTVPLRDWGSKRKLMGNSLEKGNMYYQQSISVESLFSTGDHSAIEALQSLAAGFTRLPHAERKTEASPTKDNNDKSMERSNSSLKWKQQEDSEKYLEIDFGVSQRSAEKNDSGRSLRKKNSKRSAKKSSSRRSLTKSDSKRSVEKRSSRRTPRKGDLRRSVERSSSRRSLGKSDSKRRLVEKRSSRSSLGKSNSIRSVGKRSSKRSLSDSRHSVQSSGSIGAVNKRQPQPQYSKDENLSWREQGLDVSCSSERSFADDSDDKFKRWWGSGDSRMSERSLGGSRRYVQTSVSTADRGANKTQPQGHLSPEMGMIDASALPKSITVALPTGDLGVVFKSEEKYCWILSTTKDSPMLNVFPVGMVVDTLTMPDGTELRGLDANELHQALAKSAETERRTILLKNPLAEDLPTMSTTKILLPGAGELGLTLAGTPAILKDVDTASPFFGVARPGQQILTMGLADGTKYEELASYELKDAIRKSSGSDGRFLVLKNKSLTQWVSKTQLEGPPADVDETHAARKKGRRALLDGITRVWNSTRHAVDDSNRSFRRRSSIGNHGTATLHSSNLSEDKLDGTEKHDKMRKDGDGHDKQRGDLESSPKPSDKPEKIATPHEKNDTESLEVSSADVDETHVLLKKGRRAFLDGITRVWKSTRHATDDNNGSSRRRSSMGNHDTVTIHSSNLSEDKLDGTEKHDKTRKDGDGHDKQRNDLDSSPKPAYKPEKIATPHEKNDTESLEVSSADVDETHAARKKGRRALLDGIARVRKSTKHAVDDSNGSSQSRRSMGNHDTVTLHSLTLSEDKLDDTKKHDNMRKDGNGHDKQFDDLVSSPTPSDKPEQIVTPQEKNDAESLLMNVADAEAKKTSKKSKKRKKKHSERRTKSLESPRPRHSRKKSTQPPEDFIKANRSQDSDLPGNVLSPPDSVKANRSPDADLPGNAVPPPGSIKANRPQDGDLHDLKTSPAFLSSESRPIAISNQKQVKALQRTPSRRSSRDVLGNLLSPPGSIKANRPQDGDLPGNVLSPPDITKANRSPDADLPGNAVTPPGSIKANRPQDGDLHDLKTSPAFLSPDSQPIATSNQEQVKALRRTPSRRSRRDVLGNLLPSPDSIKANRPQDGDLHDLKTSPAFLSPDSQPIATSNQTQVKALRKTPSRQSRRDVLGNLLPSPDSIKANRPQDGDFPGNVLSPPDITKANQPQDGELPGNVVPPPDSIKANRPQDGDLSGNVLPPPDTTMANRPPDGDLRDLKTRPVFLSPDPRLLAMSNQRQRRVLQRNPSRRSRRDVLGNVLPPLDSKLSPSQV